MQATVTIEVRATVLVLGDGRAHDPVIVDLVGSTGLTVVHDDDAAAGMPGLIVLAAGDELAEDRIHVLDEVVALHPGVRVVIAMPSGSTRGQLRRAMRAGADGIVLDHELREALAPTILAVAAGQLVVPTGLGRRLSAPALSHREKEVMALVAQGYTNATIGATLFIAESTVKTHLSAALRKLDVSSRAEAAALVLDPDEGHGLGIQSVVQAGL
jgi:DNA-binding NarL/FixJ family response regulator